MIKIIKILGKKFFKALGYYPVNLNGLKYKVFPHDIGFWRKASAGKWEPETFNILSKFLTSESFYFDLGAWIGPTVLYASKLCKKVICVEPDDVAYYYLLKNTHMNRLTNISHYHLAIAPHNGTVKMSTANGPMGNSTTTLLEDRKDGFDVTCYNWNTFLKIHEIKKIDFLKIDIEGSEFVILPTFKDYLSKYKPIVYLSVHPHRIPMETRKEKMQIIIDVMSVYKRCFTSDLRFINIDTLKNNIKTGQSYLFMK